MSAVNDFCFKIGTVNGTGSASANGLLMQAIFRMGIPVVGKNVFPSNIQGLPTWYEIRVSKDAYSARTDPFDLMVAMNPATYPRDIAEIRQGGYLMYDSSWPMEKALLRDDMHMLGIPLGEMCNATFTGDRERTLMKNIAYAGALAALLHIDMTVVEAMLKEKFGRKKHLLESNYRAIRLGYDFAQEHFACPLPFHLNTMNATGDYVLMDGNTAAALGCVYAGATVGAWYPITPATSLMENFRAFCERFRKDPETGQRTFCIVQAEDELAAAGMVIGAGWMGARAHAHCRAGDFADGGVRRSGLLRGSTGGLLRCAAHRAFDRHAHAHAAGRPAVHRVSLPRRHQAHAPLPGQSGGVFHDGAGRVRPGRTIPDTGVRDDGPGHRDERLDVPPAGVG